MKHQNNNKCRCERSLKWIATKIATNINFTNPTNPITSEKIKRYYYCPSCLLSKEYCHCEILNIPLHKLFVQENFYDMLENKDPN
jgi:hypothetical protein